MKMHAPRASRHARSLLAGIQAAVGGVDSRQKIAGMTKPSPPPIFEGEGEGDCAAGIFEGEDGGEGSEISIRGFRRARHRADPPVAPAARVLMDCRSSLVKDQKFVL